jgi:hypothetical protein
MLAAPCLYVDNVGLALKEHWSRCRAHVSLHYAHLWKFLRKPGVALLRRGVLSKCGGVPPATLFAKSSILAFISAPLPAILFNEDI